ncbi:MAG: Holliday junction resolvase RuvX [Candidatus Omnitrophica bacterium]|nr:Holliday junction resolvase RuvX [Candidatus Omnitrophota bacterium]MBU4589566.1 Holliday junction resolvase RuvX [Candidatus Omnitrophota bacterium]
MRRILGLDVGEKRIGVAVSDALGITAQGLETIKQKDALAEIKSLIKQYDVEKIIIGMPLNMNGSKGERARFTDDFLVLLKKETDIETLTVDERLTTAQGERILLEADLSRKKRKRSIDKIAAQLILQTYLDSHVQENRTG